ncbi:hypothetical protein SAY86_028685 [Trapa natans]|uniref:Uncharacterized protein n=1 Tax=Trapa natans TaxID=22666 RepID=A0AAN7M106_TRANT|nr:hypothetical protein SAY86_028685 [Trapa natans]
MKRHGSLRGIKKFDLVIEFGLGHELLSYQGLHIFSGELTPPHSDPALLGGALFGQRSCPPVTNEKACRPLIAVPTIAGRSPTLTLLEAPSSQRTTAVIAF